MRTFTNCYLACIAFLLCLGSASTSLAVEGFQINQSTSIAARGPVTWTLDNTGSTKKLAIWVKHSNGAYYNQGYALPGETASGSIALSFGGSVDSPAPTGSIVGVSAYVEIVISTNTAIKPPYAQLGSYALPTVQTLTYTYDPAIQSQVRFVDLGSFGDFSASYLNDSDFEGSFTPVEIDPEPEEPDAEFFALGLEDSLDQADPADTIQMLIEAAGVEGSGITKEALIGEVQALGANPAIALEGVELANGDKITFSVDGATIEGTIVQGADGSLLWTESGTQIVDTSTHTELVRNADGSYSVKQVSNVTTSKTNDNGSTTVSTSKINKETGKTETKGTGTAQEGEGRTGMSSAEEIAGAKAEAEAGAAEGQAEGQAAFDEVSQEASDSMAEASEKLQGATDGLKGKMSSYRPFDGVAFGQQNSYSVSFPLGDYSAPITLPLDHPSVSLIRAVELFIVSLFGVRFFFKILIV
ncbi:hypothetical protein HW115_01400 [Verrucomicrobiaceae bacterium N1E253]|uniref:Uncharacterized protein n=1 Tax=Oceaniferula marina TaxID=2748318 RepID=A0A851GHZ9_9BACT|nr:hypothetical protein [Oceaniferula marina]NWK54250.1 hypothetical protein [Oceaniferula marina]